MNARPRHSRRGREGESGRSAEFLSADLEALNLAMRQYELSLDEEASRRMLRFAGDLLLWNDRLNLLSRPDAQNVIRKHVAASMGVFLLTQPGPSERWIDVGTGAGFPGVVLKIARPELSIHLLDSARKRCIFLAEVCRDVGLGHVPIFQLRAETMLARGEGVGAYDVVTARAVASLSDSLRGFGPLVAPRGRLITFKGPLWSEEAGQVRDTGLLKTTGFALEAATRVPWSLGHILSFRKV